MNAFCGVDTGRNVFVLLFDQQFICPFLRNVTSQCRKPDDPFPGARFKHHRCVLSKPNDAAFFCTDRELQVRILNAVDDLVAEKLLHNFPVFRMYNTHGIFTNQVFVFVAESPAAHFIQVGEIPVDVRIEDHIVGIFNQRLVIGGQGELFGHILAHHHPHGVGEIFARPFDPNHFALFVVHRNEEDFSV
ncbi:hypothetical protein D3C86_1335940 [compost metagenome]